MAISPLSLLSSELLLTNDVLHKAAFLHVGRFRTERMSEFVVEFYIPQ